ncbi:MAG: hypothetical protein GY754_31300 [bacterium]|nr:hypothetical protein [bacterium]
MKIPFIIEGSDVLDNDSRPGLPENRLKVKSMLLMDKQLEKRETELNRRRRTLFPLR